MPGCVFPASLRRVQSCALANIRLGDVLAHHAVGVEVTGVFADGGSKATLRHVKKLKKEKHVIHDAPIKYWADFQTNWCAVIEPLHKGRYVVESTDVLSIPGDAPKHFLRIKDYVPGKPSHLNRPSTWPAYIAKVGSKWYPVESITEHLITRIGQIAEVPVAQSQLRVVGTQVRFLSRYFLLRHESLTHGLDIFKRYLEDEALVHEIAENKQEKAFYTF